MRWRSLLSPRHFGAVFDRHADRHMQVPVDAPAGVQAWWRAGRIELRIERAGGPAILECGTIRHVVQPDLSGRVDIALRCDEGAECLLSFGQPVQGPFVLLPPDLLAMRRARRAHRGRFLRTLARSLPDLVRWLASPKDPSRVAALRDSLGLAHVSASMVIEPDRLVPVPIGVPVAIDQPVVLVLAIYNAFGLLPDVIDRLEAHTDIPFELVVIEDCSTDLRVRPWLRARLAAFSAGKVTLIENAANLGFLASANLGLAHAVKKAAHAVLINSDVFVPAGWASRLMRPLLDHPYDIASVTPMSGASGLTTVPAIGQGAALPPGLADRLDVVAQEIAGARVIDLPTGMGFCMAMSAHFLARLPQFDPVFGAGYGEETDWCCRASALAGRHVAVPGLFVDHRGNASFGREIRDRRAIEAANLIRARHRGYEPLMARFVETDPLLTERLALGIALAAGTAPDGLLTVFLAHALGGGAEADLTARIAKCRAAGVGVAVLRVGGVRRWTIEVHGPADTQVAGQTDDFDLVARILALARGRRLVYSCGVGDRDGVQLPQLLLSLVAGPSDRLEVLMHDYLPLSPSFTLLGGDGWFHGVPPDDASDMAHRSRRPDGAPVSLAAWRQAWGALMRRADRIEVFSRSGRAMVEQVWPDCADAIQLCPHQMQPLPGDRPDPGGRVLGVLGNIRLHKGAHVLLALARNNPDMQIVLVGSLDLTLKCPPNLQVLGTYRRDEIQQIAQLKGIGAWLIPSIWPETFCFALHEALATGLPTLGFDLGAQADALLAAQAQGKPAYVVPRGTGPEEAALAAAEKIRMLLAESAPPDR